MIYFILWIVLLILFGIVLYIEEKRIQHLKEKVKTSEKKQGKKAPEDNRDEKMIWEAANTIYLYAALSKEEAKTDSLKEKQKEIIRIAETLMKESLNER